MLIVGTGNQTTIGEFSSLTKNMVGDNKRPGVMSRSPQDAGLNEVSLGRSSRARPHELERKTCVSDGIVKTLSGVERNSPRFEVLTNHQGYDEEINPTPPNSQKPEVVQSRRKAYSIRFFEDSEFRRFLRPVWLTFSLDPVD